MIFHYLDASAWVKRYYLETGTGWVQDLFMRSRAMACASLGVTEVIATLARKQKAREIEPPLFEQKVRELEEDWRNFIQIQLTAEAVEKARNLARQLALRGADAVHLASALLLQSRFTQTDDQLIFITADQELKQAAQTSSLTVIDPNEQEDQHPTQSQEARDPR